MQFSQIVQHSTELWLALGLLGSALEAFGEYKKWPKLVAFAQRLEAASVDLPKLIRGSRKTADENAKGPPGSKPSGDAAVGPQGGQDVTEGNVVRLKAASSLGTVAAICLALMSCSSSKPPPVHIPTEAEMQKLCPALLEASVLKCAEIAVRNCRGFDSLDECPNGEKARTECEAARQKEAEKCR